MSWNSFWSIFCCFWGRDTKNLKKCHYLITASCIRNQQCMLRCLCAPSHATLEIKQKKVLFLGQKLCHLHLSRARGKHIPHMKGSGDSGSSTSLRGRLRNEGPSCQGGTLLPERALFYRAPHFWGTAYSQVPAFLHLDEQEAARKPIAYVQK